MQITFYFRAYQFSHGKMPRGKGHWAFEFVTDSGVSQPEFAPYGSFSEARTWAAKRAKEIGAFQVNVAP